MFQHIVYGGDYNPDQWSEEVWQEDVKLMQAAGVNLVSLGIFAWAKIEPQAGRYDLTWLDRVMELLLAHGVHVNLATPTASPPAWLVRQHPDILPVTADGVTLWHGSRRHCCPHSQAYRQAAARLVTHLAEHVRSNPALVLWHVDNEYACHAPECFCDAGVAAFQAWLRQRYNSLGKLNDAWGTAFWSQAYGDWEEIMAPRRTPASVNPAQRLDWQRFCSDSWLACFEEQKAILRKATPDIPITTNFMSFFKPLDHWKWAAREDIVSNDNYPDTSDPNWMIHSGMAYDMMRSLGNGRPWFLMEQATAQVNWRERNATKRPGVMRLGSYQALARGANGVMFFQWRASASGSEKFHSGMLPHGGTDSRVWRQVTTLGGELARLDALLPSRVRSDVAILFDWENWWALEQGNMPDNELKLLPHVTALYAELFRRNITADFVHPEGDLARYRLVIAPHLYLVSERAAQNINHFTSAGGTFLMTFFSGIVDGNDRVYLGGYPAPFREMLGLWVEEFACVIENANAIETNDGKQFSCDQWSDLIRLEGAEVLARYQHDDYAGSPAVTRHRFGKGVGYYVGTRLGAPGQAWLIDLVCDQAEVQAVLKAPPGVEVTRRSDGTRSWLMLLNHSEQVVQLSIPNPGVDLVTGREVTSALELGPREIAVVESHE